MTGTFRPAALVAAIGIAFACLLLPDTGWAQRGGPPANGGDYNNPDCDFTVTGTNQSPQDAIAVSTAINGPGAPDSTTVCLVGDFNFGETGFVSIFPQGNVGELRITGIDGATIWFGQQPLRFMAGSTLGELTIDHIRFVRPTITAITIFEGNDLVQISDNIIDGVQTFILPGFDVSVREGIVVTSAFGDIEGQVVIRDNWVDAGNYDHAEDATIGVSSGILVVGEFTLNDFSTNAEVEVSENTVVNWSGTGIELIGLDGDTVVEHNLVAPGSIANDTPGICSANGIVLRGTSNAVVRRNTIDVVPASTLAQTDIECAAAIHLRSQPLLALPSSDNLIRNNQIRGSGLFGIVLQGSPVATNENNTFIANQLATFTAAEADVWIDSFSNSNTFKGDTGSVIDDGTGNVFKGGAP